jgi:hypothetical protein
MGCEIRLTAGFQVHRQVNPCYFSLYLPAVVSAHHTYRPSYLVLSVNACNNERYLHYWKKIQSTNRQKIEHSKDLDDVIEEDLDDVDDFLVEKSYAMYLGLQPPNIFYGFLDVYMVRLVTNWSREIRNKDVLNKVNSMIFAKFAFMQNHTNKIIASISLSESIGISYMLVQMNTIDQLKEKLKNLKEYDMEKELNQLSKFIDRLFINEETRSYFRHKKVVIYQRFVRFSIEKHLHLLYSPLLDIWHFFFIPMFLLYLLFATRCIINTHGY